MEEFDPEESILAQIKPEPWDQERSVAFEVAREVIGDVIVGSAAALAIPRLAYQSSSNCYFSADDVAIDLPTADSVRPAQGQRLEADIFLLDHVEVEDVKVLQGELLNLLVGTPRKEPGRVVRILFGNTLAAVAAIHPKEEQSTGC